MSFHHGRSSQNELGRLGPREEPERDEGRAETGRDVQRDVVFAVQALGQRRAEVREAELSARVGQHDLAGVHVAGEHELEAPVRAGAGNG